jgi:hypothetical protein
MRVTGFDTSEKTPTRQKWAYLYTMDIVNIELYM